MARFKGYYINLSRSTQRRERMLRHIDEEGLTETYQRYEAIEGKQCDPEGRNLTGGEIGLWETLIELLEKEKSSNDYEFLHVMEDDCIMSKEFKEFCRQLPNNNLDSDIIMTEMYANPSAYKYLVDEHDRLKKEKKVKIEYNNYTGCVSSALIHISRIRTVLSQLKTAYEQVDSVLPLDNELRRLDQQGKLSVSRVAPFITSIIIEDVKDTTIQNHINSSIADTQVFCALLRRKLSTLDNETTTKAITKIFLDLAEMGQTNQREKIQDKLIKSIVNIAEEEKVLRYKWHYRLKGEKDNKQFIGD